MSELSTIPEKKNFTSNPDSLKSIINALEKDKDLEPGKLCSIIRNAKVKVEDLAHWADFDHPVRDSYGRKQVHIGENFEVMVMSWRPGDFSTIHDHGHTQWGAVQIFGPAEHATFRYEDGMINTLARWQVEPGDILGVGHSLIHQMGNPSKDTFFLSLHVYGEFENIENVTGDARIFELEEDRLQRVDGGVFFGLKSDEINSLEEDIKGDFATTFRHGIELAERLRRVEQAGKADYQKTSEEVYLNTFSSQHKSGLKEMLESIIGENGHHQNSMQWRILNHELKRGARLQSEWKGSSKTSDDFHRYAEMYDSLIGRPCLDSFMSKYLYFIDEKYPVDFKGSEVISLGVGTGLVEEFMMKELQVPYEKLYGIDISQAMVNEARARVQSDVGDVLELDPSIKLWDIAYSGLNVFHYLDHSKLQEAIEKTAGIVRDGGWFIGDFITPDHIRWYPNTMESDKGDVISLRTPHLVEEDGRVFQESEIINLDFSRDEVEINYAGNHKRFLPPMHRMRIYFERAFKGQVDLYDAHTLELIPDSADTCPSTRYVLVAQKSS